MSDHRAIAYLRVSTTRKAESGLGIEGQVDTITREVEHPD